MKTAKELRDKFDADLEELQENCNHEKLSDWMMHMWAPGHLSPFEIKVCLKCDKTIEKRQPCDACGDYYVDKDLDNHSFDNLCSRCKRKGKHYCPVHKIFYDSDACPECNKAFGEL